MAALAERLPAVLKGEDRPKDVVERLTLAQMCYDTKHPAAATRFWAEALEADPKLGDDRRAQHRYNAACAAALAAAGQAKDDPPPDETARARLREQAMDWLEGRTRRLDEAPRIRPRPGPPLHRPDPRSLEVDTDLAGIRDADALAKLPEAERKDWHSLWADVNALLTRAAKP